MLEIEFQLQLNRFLTLDYNFKLSSVRVRFNNNEVWSYIIACMRMRLSFVCMVSLLSSCQIRFVSDSIGTFCLKCICIQQCACVYVGLKRLLSHIPAYIVKISNIWTFLSLWIGCALTASWCLIVFHFISSSLVNVVVVVAVVNVVAPRLFFSSLSYVFCLSRIRYFIWLSQKTGFVVDCRCLSI